MDLSNYYIKDYDFHRINAHRIFPPYTRSYLILGRKDILPIPAKFELFLLFICYFALSLIAALFIKSYTLMSPLHVFLISILMFFLFTFPFKRILSDWKRDAFVYYNFMPRIVKLDDTDVNLVEDLLS